MSNFKSKSIKLSYLQKIQASAERVFPLLCPTREYEWIETWNCDLIHSNSGIAEKNCVFRTGFFGEPSKIDLSDEPTSDVWVVTHYEPNKKIEFVRMNSIRVSCISFTLVENGDGTTHSLVDQLLIGLTEQGNRSLGAIAESFPFEFAMGEAMLNHYLITGNILPIKAAIEIASKK
ncbi:MAG: hypothetical protein NT007_14430 [Candidatus Kapabacteria bacterium]|nr:hypothetical protein [Candidatus Kapabacteria bacterium]